MNFRLGSYVEKGVSDVLCRVTQNEPARRIYQYNLLAWPDHGIPPEPGIVLEFLEVINSKQAECRTSGPVVVHCRLVTGDGCAQVT